MNPIYDYAEKLKKYLESKIQETYYVDVIPVDAAQEFVLLVDLGGNVIDNASLIQYKPELFVVCQFTNNRKCKETAYKIFNELKAIYSANIEGLLFSSISATETPSPLGNIGKGNFQYICSYKVLTGGTNEENN